MSSLKDNIMSKSSLLLRCKKDILNIYQSTIEAVRPESLVANSLKFNNNKLIIQSSLDEGSNVELDISRSKIHVLGGGKSVLGMACELARFASRSSISSLFSDGCLSLPTGLKEKFEFNLEAQSLLNSINVECLFGAENNLPDNQSVNASRIILDKVKKACDVASELDHIPLFIVLLGGGGSACLTSPRHISLDKKLEIIRFLVKRGADIVELNKVRSYFSSIKGGHLAYHIMKSHSKAKILTLIISDVVGDPIRYIASGPTFISNKNTLADDRQQMLGVMSKYGYSGPELDLSCPDEASLLNLSGRTIINQIVGNNRLVLKAVEERAKSLGYLVKTLGNDLQGYSDVVVRKIIQAGDSFRRDHPQEKILVIGGGEVTVNKLDGETWGKGGRVQEMALDYLIYKLNSEEESNEAEVDIFLAGSTDGQDGPTDVGACLASYVELSHANQKTITMQRVVEAKKTHNSYEFWSRHKPDWLIKTGLTGTNLMDIYMYLVVHCK